MKKLFDFLQECGDGGGIYATPGNTMGMGNPYADAEGASEPITPVGAKPKKLMRKRKRYGKKY